MEACGDNGKEPCWRKASGRRLCALPTTPPAFITTDLLSAKAKVRVMGEVFVPRGPSDEGETVAAFVRRRLGPEFLDYVINPFVAGVYASDPAQLNLKAAFPKLYQLEKDYGGLFRGMLRKKRAQRNGSASPMPKARLISFASGMQALPQALAASLGTGLRTGTMVTRVAQHEGGFLVQAHSSARVKVFAAKQVVLASPAFVSAPLLMTLDPETARLLQEIPYAPVAVAFYGFQREAVALLEPDFARQETEAIQREFQRKRTRTLQRLAELDIEVEVEPGGSFYVWANLSRLPAPLNDGMVFFEKSLERKVITVPGAFFDVNPGRRRAQARYQSYTRFSFGPPMQEVDNGFDRLATLIGR